MYGDIGKGRPAMLLSRGGGTQAPATKMQQLMRRSSSGTFSSSSSSEGSMFGSPTKLTVPRTYDMPLRFFLLILFVPQNTDRRESNRPRFRKGTRK